MAFTKPTISGYNDSPPSNDGAQTASNQLGWDKHKEKLSDPVKTLAEEINDEIERAQLAGELQYYPTLPGETVTDNKYNYGDPRRSGAASTDEDYFYNLIPTEAVIVRLSNGDYFTYDTSVNRATADGGIVIDPARTIKEQQLQHAYPTAWATSEAVTEGWFRTVNEDSTYDRLYKAADSGTTGATTPVHTEATREASDGTVTWRYLYKITKKAVGTGTGCWVRNRPVADEYEMRWWLNTFTADSTNGNDFSVDAAVQYMHVYEDDSVRRSGRLLVPSGSTYIRHGKIIGKGFDLVGAGKDFSSILNIVSTFIDDFILDINGNAMIGGFAFRQDHRNFQIDMTNMNGASMPAWYDVTAMGSVRIISAYTITTDIRIRSGKGCGYYVDSFNDVTIIRPKAFGYGTGTTETLAGIYCPGNLAGSTTNTLRVEHPDIEVYRYGIYTEGTVELDIYSHYLERNNTAMYLNHTGGGFVNIYGGDIREPSSSAVGINIMADNVNIFGGRAQSAGTPGPGNIFIDDIATIPHNVNVYGFIGDKITDTYNFINFVTPETISGSTPDLRVTEITKYDAAVVDNTATDFFTITQPIATARDGQFILEVDVVDNSGYASGRYVYEFSVTIGGAAIQLSSINSVYSRASSADANYALALTAAISLSGSVVTVALTSNQSGTNGEGTTARVKALLKSRWNYFNKDTYTQAA